MAKILSARCLSSENTITMDATTLEITTTALNQKYTFKNTIGEVITVSSFSIKATGADLLIKFNDEDDLNEEMIFEADTWESVNEFASIANFAIKAAIGAKFKIRVLT